MEGWGVGLFIVKRMVEDTGGKVEAESTLGEGTTFRVYPKGERWLCRSRAALGQVVLLLTQFPQPLPQLLPERLALPGEAGVMLCQAVQVKQALCGLESTQPLHLRLGDIVI